MGKPIISLDQAVFEGGGTLVSATELAVLTSPNVTIMDNASLVIIMARVDCSGFPASAVQLVLKLRRGTGIAGVPIGQPAYTQASSGGNFSGTHQGITGIWVDQLPGLGAQQWTVTASQPGATANTSVDYACILVLVQ